MTTESPIEQLVRDTENLEPGDVHVGDYIQKPEAETEEAREKPGMIVADLESAGWTYIYDTVTREPSLCNNNMLITQLGLLRPDGTPVFQRKKPEVPAWRGAFRCFLHPASPDRKLFDNMGLPVCHKRGMPNQFQADNHGKNKHRDEWAANVAMKTSAQEAEDREERRAMVQAITGHQQAPVPIVDEVDEISDDGVPVTTKFHRVDVRYTKTRVYGECSCGFVTYASTELKLKNKIRAHRERS